MVFRIQFTHSITYAQRSRHRLDICRPRQAIAAPVIIFFYGGAWQSGYKELYSYVAKALARRGYVAVVPDYRIYPEVRYPDFLDDGALVVRWVKDNIAQFGGDPDKLFLKGHSAGAHIAAMLSIDARWLGKVTDRPETQPIFHVAPGAPPALLVTGGRDRLVEPGNSRRLAARLVAVGNAATVRTYEWVGHFIIIAALAPFLQFFVPVLRDVDAFITETLRAPRFAIPQAPLLEIADS